MRLAKAGILLAASLPLFPQPSASPQLFEWRYYGGDMGNSIHH